MWFGAFLTIIALCMLFWKFGPMFRQAILGHDIIADVVATGFFMWLFAMTGTISGMMIAISAGTIISIMLLVGKKLFTSRTLHFTRDGWTINHRWIVHRGALYNWTTLRKHYARNSAVHP